METENARMRSSISSLSSEVFFLDPGNIALHDYRSFRLRLELSEPLEVTVRTHLFAQVGKRQEDGAFDICGTFYF